MRIWEQRSRSWWISMFWPIIRILPRWRAYKEVFSALMHIVEGDYRLNLKNQFTDSSNVWLIIWRINAWMYVTETRILCTLSTSKRENSRRTEWMHKWMGSLNRWWNEWKCHFRGRGTFSIFLVYLRLRGVDYSNYIQCHRLYRVWPHCPIYWRYGWWKVIYRKERDGMASWIVMIEWRWMGCTAILIWLLLMCISFVVTLECIHIYIL